MSLGMGLLRGATTQSSPHDAVQIEIDSETGHDQSARKLIRTSTKESRFIVCRPKMPWHPGCSSMNHPHLRKDNEEINVRVKHVHAMLDVATIAEPVYDQEGGD
jgi:hypothetical protein